MIGKSAVKLFVGVVATAIAGTAMANTTLDGSSTGDIFLNIEDTTNNTSYLYDTGISQGSFTGNTSFSVSLSGDTALTSFLSQTGNFEYSVVSATRSGAGPFATSTIFITGNATSTPVNLTNADTNAAQSTISSFLTAADNVNTTSSSSVVLPTGSDWGQALTEGVVSNQLFSVTLTPDGHASGAEHRHGVLQRRRRHFIDVRPHLGLLDQWRRSELQRPPPCPCRPRSCCC